MKKNWPMLVVLGLAGTGCELDPGTLFRGDGGSAGIGAGGGENAGAGGIGGTGGIGGSGGIGGTGGAAPMDPECLDKPDGMPLAAQTAGDCVVLVCDGEGHRRVKLSPEDADDFDPCTKDECKNQEAVHSLLAAGTVLADQVDGDCSEKQCNALGVVAEVPDDMDTGALVECRIVSCENGVKTTQIAQSGASCGAAGAFECNSDGLCVKWCMGNVGFPGESLQSVGPHNSGAATGDVDNDGLLDLVFVDYNATTFRVMRGLGAGKFDTPVEYVSGHWASSVTLADLDGKDGLDVVISEAFQGNSNNPGGVRVYFNNGAGNFIGGVQYTTGAYACEVAAADMNGDGKPDLAVANYYGGDVSVLMNQGGGTFAPHMEHVGNYAVGGASSVIAADLDGDMLPDLAVASLISQRVSILVNAGDGLFAPPIQYYAADQLVSIHAADLDGDNDLDLAVTTRMGNTVGVMRNLGDATFTPLTKYPTGKNAARLTTADLNGDGHLDIAASNYDSGTVSTLLNKKNGTFDKATNYAMGNVPLEVIAADFTGDGAPDLVAANGTGYLRMLVNDGNGNFPPAVPHYKTGTKPTSIAARDFNGDNVPDLAVTSFDDNTNTVSILRNDKSGKFDSVAKYEVPGKLSTVVSEDFDGDGDFDLAVSESTRGYVAVLINQGNSIFAPGVEYLSGAENADAVASSDVDGDGDFDLVVAHRNGAGGGTLGVLLNDSKGIFAAQVPIPVGDGVAGTARSTLGVADLNGDGKPDVVVGRVDHDAMHVLRNDGTGGFTYLRNIGTFMGNDITFLAIADMNGDSWPDVVVNNARIMENKSVADIDFTALTHLFVGAGTVAIADMDGNGKPDLAQANAVTAELNILMKSDQGAFSSAKHYAAGVHESYNGSIVASDLNADGRPDLAVIDDDGVNIYLNTCMP